MNSKTKVFLLPILLVALCACFAFGMFTMESRATTVSALGDADGKIYFVNNDNWAVDNDTMYAHMWGGTEAETTWPGAVMTKEDYQINGKDVYSVVIGDRTSVIFTNNKGAKTADQTVPADKPYCVQNNGSYWYTLPTYNANFGGWIEAATVAESTATVHVYCDYATVKVHSWTENGNNDVDDDTWPGTALDYAEDHWYTYEATKLANYDKCFIFNDGNGNEMPTLTYDGDGYYVYFNSSWHKYDAQPDVVNGEVLVKTDYTTYLNYYNADDWTTVKVYSYLHKDGSGDPGTVIEDTTWDARPSMTIMGETRWCEIHATYNVYEGYTRYFIFSDETGGEGHQYKVAFEGSYTPYYVEGTWYHLTPTKTPMGWLEENQIARYRTAYFYNAAGWEHVYAYTWNIKEGQDDIGDCAWGSEPEMTAATELGDGWFKTAYFNTYAAVGYTKGIMFKGAQGDTDDKTGDLTYNWIYNYYVYGVAGSFNAKPTETVLGWMTDATFDAIEKTDVTVYYYNANSNWATPYCFSFNTKNATNYDDTVGFPGTAMTEESNGWYSYDMTMYEGYAKTFIFSNGQSGAGNQTADLSYNADKPYYADGYWYEDSAKAEMANNYYLEGTFGTAGEGDWSYATAIKGGAGTGTNVAEWHNVTLTAGTQFKALRGNNDGTTTWYTSMSTSGVNDRFEDNVRIFFDGVYNVYLNNEGKVYVNFAQEELLNATAKYKVSDDNAWLLIVAGLKLDALGEGPYTLGWTKLGSGEDHDTNTYYTGITFKGGATRTAEQVMGEGFALILDEFAYEAGTYQLYVKVNGVRVAAVTVNVTRTNETNEPA